MNIIDRRQNPSGKSLANRQRFIERAKGEVRKAVTDSLKRRKLGDVAEGEKISIPSRGIAEPTFRRARQGGRREYVVPGNKEYIQGDRIPKPPSGGGDGRPEASAEGEGEDAFEFALSKEEFLDILFEDMELPDLVKTSMKEAESFELSRAGYSVSGSPSNLSLARTMRNSLARRIGLARPKPEVIAELERLYAEALEEGDPEAIAKARTELEVATKRLRIIPYIDPTDVRYNLFQTIPKPNTQAVMFCLMDVSGSMTEHMKDLAKRFFLLLHVFLTRRYKTVEVVFIRHTSIAQEVDEDTFFHGRETGGTVVSTALEEMLKVLRARYPLDAWNVYAAQASDGDNIAGDGSRCVALLDEEILPVSQYFAYIEVGDKPGSTIGFVSGKTNLWRTYSEIAQRHGHFSMRRVAEAQQIFPVFHDLFAKNRERV